MISNSLSKLCSNKKKYYNEALTSSETDKLKVFYKNSLNSNKKINRPRKFIYFNPPFAILKKKIQERSVWILFAYILLKTINSIRYLIGIQ